MGDAAVRAPAEAALIRYGDRVIPNFVTPHCHVQSLDSASTPEAFAKRELELGTGALVITDHGSLAGCQTVYELARKKKLTPVLGLEGYFRDDDCPIFKAAGIDKVDGKYATLFKYGHFTCHFLDQDAFKVGVRLLSRAPVEQHGQEAKPLFDWAAMEELGASNTTITTGCLIGMVQRHLLDRQDPVTARKYYERLRAIVRPGNFYVEAFPHVCSHNWVAGVFVTVQEDGGEPFKLRWYAGKTLKTNVGEIKADELAKAFNKGGGQHTHLLAVKDYRTWTERVPARIVSVEHVEDFIQNECRPFAPDGDVQLGANQFMVELAREYGDPVLISDDSHYAHPEEKVVQDVRLAQSGSWRFYGSYHRQSSAEAYQYFNERMGIGAAEFRGWVENSLAWASRFKDFKMQSQPSLPVKFFEAKYKTFRCSNSLEYTMHLIEQHGRMDWNNPIWTARLQQEIQLLYDNGTIDLLPYFMTVEEVCRLYRDAGQLTGPGRGSAAGLLLTYLLGITHVDPIRYGLSLDRFLTLDRIRSGKLPDIDQDLQSRELLVGPDGNSGWLRERFGDHVAQISTITTLKLRNAVLDVARYTMGEVPKDIAELAHKFEMPPQGLEDIKFVLGYEDSGNWVEGSIKRDPALQAYVAAYPAQWEIVQKCLGLGRGRGRHACGYAIANQPLEELGIPLTTIGGVRCTEFTAAAVEAAGVLKYDFLTVSSLQDIASAIRLTQERAGNGPVPPDGLKLGGKWVPALRLVPAPRNKDFVLLDQAATCSCGHRVDNHQYGQQVCGSCGCDWAAVWYDVHDLPEDQAVFADVATGDTETVFQLSKPAALQGLRHFAHRRPDGTYPIDSIEAMSAFTALDRPGPLDAYVRTPGTADGRHNMLVEYARRARGAERSQDIPPIFDRLFPETNGVMVYQEQLERLYREVTGCTGAEAVEFRGNVAKKKKEKIVEAYPRFIAGAEATLGSRDQAEAMWAFIQSWAQYGFNKSHAVCYMVTAYACAWLKHYYPLEWWVSVLRYADKDEINEVFWRHCGHLIDLPDVTQAVPNFTIVGSRIQAPLGLLQGVGPTASEELIAGAPYKDFDDYVAKIEATKAARTAPGKVKKKIKEVDQATGEKVVRTVEVDGIIRGRSALNKGITYRLIVTGAMAKLVPAGTSTLETMEAYELAVWNHENAVRAARRPKPKRPKKAPDPVKAEYVGLTQYTRYQLRKEILPAISEDIRPYLLQRGHARVTVRGKGYGYAWGGQTLALAAGADLDRVDAADTIPEDGIRGAVAGYVVGVRTWKYGRPVKDKEAMEVVIDLGDGARRKFVRWPDRDTGILDEWAKDLIRDGGLAAGALAVLVVHKYREGKPFTVDHVEVVQAPPGADKEEEGKDEEE